jgi:hypothetical protein
MRTPVSPLLSPQSCTRRVKGRVLPNTFAVPYQQGYFLCALACHSHQSASFPRRRFAMTDFTRNQRSSTNPYERFNTHTAGCTEAV